MPDEYREHMFQSALSEVTRFIEKNPGYSLHDTDSESVRWQRDGRGTNFVLWGDHDGTPVIYKFYHPDWGTNRYRNELACLRHFAGAGCVPDVHAALPESLIVMTCLPGRYIMDEARDLAEDERSRLGRELGAAVGRMIELPVPEERSGYSIVRDYDIIPWDVDVRRAVASYVDLCRRSQDQLPSGRNPFYEETLALVEKELDRIPSRRQVIYHEDFHCFAHDGELSGVFDVEMARLGTDLMQLERVFRHCAPDGLDWEDVLMGYRETTGRDLTDADYVHLLAMALFYFHIRISRYGYPNANQDWVARFLPNLREEALRYQEYVDLKVLLPSL